MDAAEIDDPGHEPWSGHAKKICCTMGTPMDWEAMQMSRYSSTTPMATYARGATIMQSIIGNAVLLDPVCAGNGTFGPSIAFAGDPGYPPHEMSNRCSAIVGRWNWFTGYVADFYEGGTWATTTDGHTGTWRCNAEGSVTVTPDAGGWQDTVMVSHDGASLSGQNQHGVPLSATRAGPGNGPPQRECPEGYNPYGCN